MFDKAFTEKKANTLGLTGRVKNLSNGNVQVLVKGANEKVSQLIDWCHKGSPYSKVNRVQVIPLDTSENWTSFRIDY